MVNGTAWAGVAETVKYGVYLGVWTNWSRGRILGSTLTLSREDGNYLLSFTAFFIGLVSTRFWRIVCFILHNSFSTSTPRDAVYHQQQAILRNSSSVDSGLVTFLQLAWAWRRTTKRALVRLCSVIATAAFFAVAFTIAGGFSSSISTGISNDVLLDGSDCGLVIKRYSSNEDLNLLGPYTSREANSAANYAQQCYGTNTSGMFGCGTFVKARIPSSVENQTACPFAEGLCESDANLRLDSGYIDTHEHLGLNAPFDERILFRTVLQCAPLVTEGFTSNISTAEDNYTTYNYGSQSPGSNYTYKASNSETQYHTKANDFKLQSYLSYTLNGSIYPAASDFTPTPGLFPKDGDLMLTFLTANGVRFLEKTNDPWYRGNLPGNNMSWNAGANVNWDDVVYRMDQAASPMACLQQYQFCNPALPEESRCGPLAGSYDAQGYAAHLFNITYDQILHMTYVELVESGILDTPAAARYFWLLVFLTLSVPEPTTLLNVLGPNSLASQQSLARSTSVLGTIPSNQWQLDVKNWWAIYMASLQSGMVNIAYGTRDPALKPYEMAPVNSHVQKLCDNQKILSSDYTSFSVFGLCFIYVLGVLIVVISYLLEPIQAWMYRRKNAKEYAYLEWTANETLQLQRMAYQGLESGHWSRYTDRIPLTNPGEILADLPRSYPLEKKEPDVEQGNAAKKRTVTIVTTEKTAPLTQVETKSSTLTPYDDESLWGQAGVESSQTEQVDPPGPSPRDHNIHSPVVPHVEVDPQPPTDAVTGEGSRGPATTTPKQDEGPAGIFTCPPVEDKNGS